ncbi:MAG: alpha/beta fold hydrolase [Pseudomonadota bacterium]
MQRAPDGTAFEITGPEDAPVLVLIHGLGLARALWTPHMVALEDYRVVTYDLYGHGDSSPGRESASLTLFSDQIAGLLDTLEIARVSLIGFSIGGMINRRFALDHSDRLEALVILNSPHDRGGDAQELVEARAATVRQEGRMATLPAALERWFTPEFRLTQPEALNLVRSWRQVADPESYAQAAWVLAHGVRELIAPAPAIAHPTLVITCENDSGSTPAMSWAITAEIPGATCQIIPHLQHLGLMEEPDAFTDPILAFLAGALK